MFHRLAWPGMCDTSLDLMMSRLPPKPDLSWKDDGTPVDEQVGDVYFSRHNGLEETRVVFLKGCGLPEAWQGQPQFTIGELGFGTGLNFLAAWELWRATRPPGAWLHFVSFEGFLLDSADAAHALAAWPSLGDLPDRLARAWPDRARGVQRHVWAEEGLTLTLHIGDIAETLPEARLQADAWFLDGFSPAKNEAMWAETLWPLIAERSVRGASAATFTVAGHVRRGLASAGFSVEKAPGHGHKRERLEACLPTMPPASPDVHGLRPLQIRPEKVRIVGAGIAGATAARVLMDRGLEVEVLDTAQGPANGASGNPVGLIMPRLDAADTVQARLLIDAYLAARRFYTGRPGISETDVTHRPKDDREAERIAKVLADPPLGLENLEALREGGQLHKGALIVEPGKLIPALLEGAELKLAQTFTLDDLRDDVPTVLAAGEKIISLLPWLKIEGRLGQVESFLSEVDAPPFALAAGDYALALGRVRLWGATFEPASGDARTSDEARETNLAALERLNPYWQHEARRANLQSRAGIRATTPDRLPLIGRVPDHDRALKIFDGVRHGQTVAADAPLSENLLVAGGFGSRGFTWGPWAGEILAAQLLGEPAPASERALQAIAPMRQILRDLKRSR